ncbi:MAG: glutamine synthetase family protein [Alphaproteobacteria bacterium]|nr:glutamine synthetase family protein [Alphaproteobacteria bacterium]MBU0795763.1 glutamine synthetase family protein [Alphaproteobacteria bacterium]MBU0887386.1 glutamine synthetase family protein [Alphaproteobacteria bacterium]MBU1811733.1 glutamine synthetase family protein [Alphaproteobacteria bacterium]
MTHQDRSAEAETFLVAHPEIEFFELLVPDQLGIPRGKRVNRDGLVSAYRQGMNLPGSLFALDVTGSNVDASGLVWEEGDADRVCFPVAGTLVPVPWAPRPTGQVLMTMFEHDGRPFFADPRQVLAGVLARFSALGLKPVIAMEFEFYLLDRSRGPRGEPILARVPRTGRPQSQNQVYSLDDLKDFDTVLHAMEEACRAQDIPSDTATAEYAPGQFEINLHHIDDALKAADYGIMFKNAIKGVADQHGFEATFMAKPFLEHAGNGLHVHLSVLDSEGRNIFQGDDPLGSPALKHAIGGLSATMNDFMAVFAPNANSYRRFQAGSYAPLAPSWGRNNRTVSLRIPASSLEATRVEHRVGGSDANPYLVAAAVLAGVHYGLANKIDPGPPTEGNAYDKHRPSLSDYWELALEVFSRSEVARTYFGESFRHVFTACRMQELKSFEAIITPLEWEWYLRLS